MYIVVDHTISDPGAFWNAVDITALPTYVKLHQTFPTADGTRAVCVWEAETIEPLRELLESQIGRVSQNEYFAVENREGIAMPSGVRRVATADER